MDNITHTLTGLVVAELAVRLRERREGLAPTPRFVRTAYLLSAAGNNLPDLDMALVPLTGGKLGYLVQHRGYTHTILIGLALSFLFSIGVSAAYTRKGSNGAKRGDFLWLGVLAALAPLLHIALDFSNEYGVHPFWPFWSGWLYGDAVFILEPLFWVATAPALFFAVSSRAGKAALASLVALAVALPLVTGRVPLPLVAAIAAFAAASTLVAWATSRRGFFGANAAAALGFSLAVLAAFIGGHARAASHYREAAARLFPGESLRDVALAPGPANAFCWSVLAVSTTKEGQYTARRATVATAPGVFPVERCYAEDTRTTAPLVKVLAEEDSSLRFRGEFSRPLAELATLARERCEMTALLRFFRVPFWTSTERGVIVGDLRYDREEGLGFAELELSEKGAPCPKNVPSWTPPRVDLSL